MGAIENLLKNPSVIALAGLGVVLLLFRGKINHLFEY